ncbi:MAG: outer membrane protein assembly factor BamD [Candidatus Chromulinivorax sp.]
MNKQKYLFFFLLFCFVTLTCKTLVSDSSSANNVQPSVANKAKSTKKGKSKTQKNSCPHEDMPAELLNASQLTELLACKQEETQKLEELKDQVEQQEIKTALEKTEEKKPKNYIINKILKAPRCPYGNIPLKKLTAKQLEEVYVYTQTHTMDSTFIIELLERLIALSDNHAGVKQYKLELADIHYKTHHIEKAAACYEDFAVLYPGSQEHEYVLYKAVACMFELSLEPDRDQTNTKKTITLIKEFLQHAKQQNLIDEANIMLQTCHNRLYEHEVYVFNFYLKKKNFTAAQMRLDYISKNFMTTIDQLTEKVAALTEQFNAIKNPVKPKRQYLVNKFLA